MVKRLFLGNQHPLPVSIAAKLAALKPAVPPDFGKILLVLPGKVARRNVRNELLKHYPGGILLPQLLTPHLLMHYQRQESPLPGAVAEELIWGRVLTKAAAHKEDFPEFFFEITRKYGSPVTFFAMLFFHEFIRKTSPGSYPFMRNIPLNVCSSDKYPFFFITKSKLLPVIKLPVILILLF